MATALLDRPELKLKSAKAFKRRPLPPKGKKVRRALVRTHNGIQRAREAKAKVGGRVSKAYDWLGQHYRCIRCGQMVPYRRADQHNILHFEDSTQKRVNLIAQAQKEKTRPPDPRKPDPAKTAKSKSKKNSKAPTWDELEQKDDDMPPAARKPTGETAPTPSNIPASSASGLIVKAFHAWTTTKPRTHLEMLGHLKGMETALVQASSMLHQFASDGMVGRKMHPLCAKPVDDAADGIAALRLNFAQAVMAIEMVYRARLEAARQQGPVPDDEYFKEVG